jgi:hypothetical protein
MPERIQILAGRLIAGIKTKNFLKLFLRLFPGALLGQDLAQSQTGLNMIGPELDDFLEFADGLGLLAGA